MSFDTVAAASSMSPLVSREAAVGSIAQFLARAAGLHRQAASLLLDAQAAGESGPQ